MGVAPLGYGTLSVVLWNESFGPKYRAASANAAVILASASLNALLMIASIEFGDLDSGRQPASSSCHSGWPQ
jgi:hypothetical protein